VAGSGAGIGPVFGSLIIYNARNPSLKKQLFSYTIQGFALLEVMGLFCLMVGGLTYPFCRVKDPSLPSIALSPMSYLFCMFLFCTSPESTGKVVGSGFERGKTNKYCVNRKKIGSHTKLHIGGM
jgi:F-type H+-transporting ATPase subunit c